MFLDSEVLSPAETLDLFARARITHLAAEGAEGPILRAVHPIVVDGALHFHGAPKGEKMELLGRPAMMVVEEILATLPSHWFHPERACPATTYFRSAHARGTLEAVEDLDVKARILQSMMETYQPAGGHRPISATDPLYAASVRNIAVVRLANAELIGRRKVGQHKPAEVRQSIMRKLWERGEDGDLAAVDAMVDADRSQLPAFLAGPRGTRFVARPRGADVAGAVHLLRDTYWNRGISDANLAAAQRNSAAWIVAVDETEGRRRVVGTARAIADGAKLAYVMDVAVDPEWRGAGVGKALMELLLDHPAVKGCRRVELHTRDAMPLYEKLGFTPMVDPAWRVGMRAVRG